MNRNLKARLARLEASTNAHRKVIIWEDGTGRAEREIARRQAAGEIDVEFVTVGWLKSGEGAFAGRSARASF
jgi:hypothetical protein